jgi:hypothetical protein
MDLMPIANKLEFEGLGTQGKTLFVNFMPMEAKTAIMLRSPLSGARIDHELPGYFKSPFMVVVRSPEYTAALAKMQEVMLALTLYNEELDGMSVKHMYPVSLPISFPVSDGNFYEVQVNFETAFSGAKYGYGT